MVDRAAEPSRIKEAPTVRIRSGLPLSALLRPLICVKAFTILSHTLPLPAGETPKD